MPVRLRLRLMPVEPVRLSFSYQYYLSSLVYRLLHDSDARRADEAHDEKHAAFSFSLLFPERKSMVFERETLLFRGPVRWYVSFLDDELARAFLSSLLREQVFLNGWWRILSFEREEEPSFSSYMFSTLSPIVLREKRDGKTWDVTLSDPSFPVKLRKHLLLKYNASPLAEEPVSEGDVFIRFVKGRVKRFAIPRDDTTIYLRASEGSFFLAAPLPFLRYAWYAGLGQLQSQGFGMIHVKEC